MNRPRKALLIAGLSLLVFCGCNLRSTRLQRDDFQHPGTQWLSWSSTERSNFVYGYTQGYEEGMYRACKAVEDLSKKDELSHVGQGSSPHTFPYARCRAGVDEYSGFKIDVTTGPDFHTYTDTITEFYTKHPEYRNIPFLYLMQFLTDKERKSADDLYSMAKSGKLSTSW